MSKNLYLLLLAVILCGGIFLRLSPMASFKGPGFDEVVYADYVNILDSRSLFDYPVTCRQYVESQKTRDEALLPPTRFLYIYAGHLFRIISHESSYMALKHVSALFTALTLFLTATFCCRLAGRAASLGVTALMSVAMSQVHQSQHVMIDGFFTFWTLLALWSLWESLRQPNRLQWLVVYAGALAALVMTKENAFFVFIAICALLQANRWLKFGTVTRRLVLATFAGALFGFALLVSLAGDLSTFLEMYRLLMAKSLVSPWAIMTGDGPWYRYLVDLILVSPLVVFLATGAAFRLCAEDNKPLLFLFLFFGFTFAAMASVKLGCNLRYTTIWDMPLRLLAFSQLGLLTAHFGRRRAPLLLALATVALCAVELRQYFVFCVDSPAYALVSRDLLRAIHILK